MYGELVTEQSRLPETLLTEFKEHPIYVSGEILNVKQRCMLYEIVPFPKKLFLIARYQHFCLLLILKVA